MFVYVIQSNHSLYFVLEVMLYLSPVHGLLYHCVVVMSAFELIFLLILYLCLLQYVCILYIIYYLVILNIGEYCFVYFLIYSAPVAILIYLHFKNG